MPKELYILRHGQTQFNAERLLQGYCNSDLTEKGIAQAIAMGQTLKKQLDNPAQWQIIASPLGRAMQTAELVCAQLGLPVSAIKTDKRVIECNLGEWEQVSVLEILRRYPELNGRNDWYLQGAGAESLAEVHARLQSWLDDKSTPNKVILVSHGLTGMILRSMLCGLSDEAMWQQDMPQDAFYHFSYGVLTRISV